MKSNNIIIDSDEIDAITGRIDSSYYSINDGVQKSKKDLSCLQNSRDLSEGVNAINDCVSFFADKMSGYKKVIAMNGASFFEQEKLLSSRVDNIETPTELTVVDDIFKVDTSTVNLSKEDDKEVNSDNNTTQVEYEDSKEVEKENLETVNKENETDEVNYDDISEIEKSEMDNINNNIETEKQDMEDKYSGKKEEISQMEDNETEEVQYDSQYTDNRKVLEEIENKEILVEEDGDLDDSESR